MSAGWGATAGWLCGAALCGLLAHEAQKLADAARPAPGATDERVFLPDPRSLKVAVMGFDGLAADVLWVRTVLAFADAFEDPDPSSARWLRVMVDTVSTLDPGWRTSYLYGGGMLRAVNDIEGSDLVYRRGAENLPEDPFFPFSLAMNAYLYHHDAETAARYLTEAAALPKAPSWYRAAAAGFLDRRGQRKAALRYLEEQLEGEEDPELKAALEEKYAEVLHDELASRLEDLRVSRREALGRDIRSLADLGDLPRDPLGGRWIIGPDGAIRSDVRDGELLEKARRQDRRLLFDLWSPPQGMP